MEEVGLTKQCSTLTMISDGIYQLVVRYPFDMFHMNSYFIQGENGFTVIDTGSKATESIDLWEKTLSSGIKVEKLVLTHAHTDHLGLASWFQEQHHVPVYISSLGYKEMVRNRNTDGSSWFRSLLTTHGCPEFPMKQRKSEIDIFDFEPDGLFENQQSIKLGDETYETIWTPGHSCDHFCFYNRSQQVMVTGDHVLAGLSPIIAHWSENDENPLKDNFASLERLKVYPTKLALPGHGELIFNMADRIDEMISGHKHRLQQVLNSVSQKEKTSWQVCQEIYGPVQPPQSFAPLMATITRLIYLELSGEVYSELKDGKLFYHSSTI
jgi:glyoxylase-like metal-dependent hydrolase (beta-lactamase superfamily II)